MKKSKFSFWFVAVLLISMVCVQCSTGAGISVPDPDTIGDDAEPGEDVADATGGEDALFPEIKEVTGEDTLKEITPPLDATGEVISELGNPCEGQEDCDSGLCIETSFGSVCTESCIEECADGWVCKGLNLYGGDLQFVCVPLYWHICEECKFDQDCDAAGAVCMEIAGEGDFCSAVCDVTEDCPPGYECVEGDGDDSHCLPTSGSCLCMDGDEGETKTCDFENEFGACSGEQVCDGADGWGECSAEAPAVEECDGIDNDC